jgi:RNA polymerase sigma-70 factor, ECF subfamily
MKQGIGTMGSSRAWQQPAPNARSTPTGATQPADAALVDRIAHGEQLAMRILYCRHSPRIYRVILRMVRNETLAEDILSDVFCDVWQTADRFEGRSGVLTWLIAIARYKAFSAMRCRQYVDLNDEAALRVPDPADGPDAALERKDRRQLIERCVDRLSPSHRAIIDLVYFNEKTVSEVAEIVSVPEATVKTRMFYARRQLAAALAPA